MRTRLLDERSPRSLRRIIGRLLIEADTVDLALARIRLAALDLTTAEIRGPSRCRVLLGQLDATTLAEASMDVRSPGPHLEPMRPASNRRIASLTRLREWLASGRLEVRSAGIGSWTPDFSIYARPGRATCLLGAHYFGGPQLTVGPSFTCILQSREAARVLGARFDWLWAAAHDVEPAIVDVLERSLVETRGVGVGS